MPGGGYSSPVVAGSRVFVTAALDDGTQVVECRDVADGRQLWEQRFAATTYPKHQFNWYASSTPALDDRRLFFAWAAPERYQVVALDQASGKELWRHDLGPFAGEHGFGASPMVVDGLVVLPNDQDGPSSLLALDGATGRERWRAERRTERTAYSTPCLYRPASGPAQLITTSWAHGVSGLDPATGETLWELPLFQNRVVGSPLVVGDLVFASAGTGGIGRQMFAVRPGRPDLGREAEVAYEIHESLPYVTTPVARGNLVFLWFDKGMVSCLDAATGKVHYSPQRIGGDFFGSPVRAGDRIYCISRSGEMVVLRAADRFEVLGRIDLGERSHSTPAIAGGVMYLRTVTHLMALPGRPPGVTGR